MLVSHATLEASPFYNQREWTGNNEYTYLLMKPGASLVDFNSKLAAFCASISEKLNNARYQAEPVRKIHLYSNKTFEPEINGSARIVFMVMITGIFIILIAWVNYVNLSTARAVNRAREVGIRKVMGSARMQLMGQFLTESLIVNVLSGGVALFLFWITFPFLRSLIGRPLPLDIANDMVFWSVFIALFAVGSILSGFYPALVLSSFKPALVLKGKFQASSHGQMLRRGLVVFQFGASIVLVTCLLTVHLQIDYLRSRELGMAMDQTLVIQVPRLFEVPDSLFEKTYKDSYQALKNELMKHPEIVQVAGSQFVPGLSLNETASTYFVRKGEDDKGKRYYYTFFAVDADYIPLIGLQILEGRNFQSGGSDRDAAIVSEHAARQFGFSSNAEAVGSEIFTSRWNRQLKIIGVVKDFYLRSPKEPTVPLFMVHSDFARFFSIKIKTDNMPQAISKIQASWNTTYPGAPFQYFFQDEKYGQQYIADMRFGQLTGLFSLLAVFIACLGLFGLSSYTILQRTKEIGIRKVLGASVVQIVNLLTYDFVKVIIVAALLAVPLAYFVLQEWLTGYAVRINLGFLIFFLPVLLILAIALTTVSFQTIRTALSNPTNSLKQE